MSAQAEKTVRGNVLVVDDDASLREFLGVLLDKEGYQTYMAGSAREGLSILDGHPVDVILADVRMPGMDGIEFLGEVRKRSREVVVIIMTAYSTWQRAVEAMRLDAFDYIRKPFDNDDIKATLGRAARLARAALAGEESSNLDRVIVGRTPALQEIHSLIRRVSATDSTILIQGESGTGKELVARALHEGSPRAKDPFISVNCGAFTETLLESEMFGHVRGAFTGAVVDKKGLLEAADQGTFFLDEVTEMSPALQVKILRMLEEREYTPVGATKPRKADVRFIAATNRDLEAEIVKGRFREDLYYRLNVIPIRLPPLRERRADIPLLAGRFLATYTRTMHSKLTAIGEEAMEILMRYDWPGNIRELENCIQRAVALADGRSIEVQDLDERIVKGIQRHGAVPAAEGAGEVELSEAGVRLEEKVEEMEKRYIVAALNRTEGNQTRAASLLGITLKVLQSKIRKYAIQSKWG